jgi:hypothetical protein
MQISAQPFKRSAERHNALLSIGNVIGSGGSAVVTECSPLQRNWHFAWILLGIPWPWKWTKHIKAYKN